MRDPHDYTIEVCIECGAQLNRGGNGRCPVSRSHWSEGGMIVRVVPRSIAEQERVTQRYARVLSGVEGERDPDAVTAEQVKRANEMGRGGGVMRRRRASGVEGRCTCGNGEAEDDRGAVLRCPVHGPASGVEGER